MSRPNDESETEYNRRLNGEIRDLAERISRVEEENKHQSDTLKEVSEAVKTIDRKVDQINQNVVTEDELEQIEAEVSALEDETTELENSKLATARVLRVLKWLVGIVSGGGLLAVVAQGLI